MRTSDFDYNLPPEAIAQTPVEPRHSARLMVMKRDNPQVEHSHFFRLGEYLQPGDLLVINQTKVLPARLHTRKPTGGKVELLLLKRLGDCSWEVLVGGKGLNCGKKVQVDNGPEAEVLAVLDGSRRVVRFSEPVEPILEKAGEMPLPPYIHTPLTDPDRYQTVYARQTGSAAAPTAGLHFTRELMDHLKQMGIEFTEVTLHVGLDTFAPVNEEEPETHIIHTEWCEVTPEAATLINFTRKSGRKIVAVGTTTVRTLESTADKAENERTQVQPMSGPTSLFILPGYHFRVVDAMITNFHLPRSTLLMLVSAFSGRERILEAYQLAVDEGYRFYSFGDAMLIL